VKLIVGLCKGLRHLHQFGLCRENLRLDCILVSEDFEARIETVRYDVQHTAPTYMSRYMPCISDNRDVASHVAPELLIFEDAVGVANDIFALGIIIWEILNGVPLAKAVAPRTNYHLCHWLGNGNRPDTSALHHPARELIRQCWSADPSQRPTIVTVLERLKSLNYQLIPGVDSKELEFFVDSIDEREKVCQAAAEAK
jgi:serine/threonine protein kinase